MNARDELFHLAVSQDMVAEEGAARLLDAYRREVLAEVQTALEAQAAAEKRRSQMPTDQSFAHGFAMAAAHVGEMRRPR
ncbi:hypothetical protein [Streptomyces sp. NPDC059708]|uniref:hypothetical protein n=1 Tax=Streptomyces sp. NPDC059708 TaxID=3346916 RepID=UPI0036B2070F